MPLYRATASNLTNLVAADGSSGGFVKDAQAGAGGLALLDDATIADLQQTLAGAGSVYGQCRALWRIIGANMNSTADQAFTKLGTFTNYQLIVAVGSNPSTSLTTAQGGIYSATSKGGDSLVASSQAYTALTTALTGANLTRTALGTGVRSDAALYLSLTTGQGSAATADIYLFGIPLS